MGKPTFKEVTKEKFNETYFRLGGGGSSGWTTEWWTVAFSPYRGVTALFRGKAHLYVIDYLSFSQVEVARPATSMIIWQ